MHFSAGTHLAAPINSRSTKPASGAGLGVREQSKVDKRRRLIEAAREVFVEKGYHTATTREIAVRAGVAIGTVFVYAKDKRDLLLLLVNDDLDVVTAKCGRLLDQPGPLLESLLAYFRLRYRYWASEPRLSGPALQETSDFVASHESLGDETRRFFSRRPLVLAHVEQMVRAAQTTGEVATDVAADRVAALIVDLYLIEVRRWLGGTRPKPAVGVKRLGEVLQLVLRGIHAAKTPI